MLPPGWQRAVDERGRTYYQNDITRQTQWECPEMPQQSSVPVAQIVGTNPQFVGEALSSDGARYNDEPRYNVCGQYVSARTHLTLCVICLFLNVFIMFRYRPKTQDDIDKCTAELNSDEGLNGKEVKDICSWSTISKAIFGLGIIASVLNLYEISKHVVRYVRERHEQQEGSYEMPQRQEASYQMPQRNTREQQEEFYDMPQLPARTLTAPDVPPGAVVGRPLPPAAQARVNSSVAPVVDGQPPRGIVISA